MLYGKVFVARQGTSTPDYRVSGGKFEVDWDVAEWMSIGPVANTELRMYYGVSAGCVGKFIATRIGNAPFPTHLGQWVTLGWENDERDERLYVERVKWTAVFPGSQAVMHWDFDCYSPPNYTVSSAAQQSLRIVQGHLTPGRKFAAGGVIHTPPAATASQPPPHTGHVYQARPVTQPTPPSRPNPGATSSVAPKSSGKGSMDLVPGRLVGFREWMVRLSSKPDDPPMLASITAKTVWPWTPTQKAVCRRSEMTSYFGAGPEHDPDDVPYGPCSCGIYAQHQPVRSIAAGSIGGVIEAWGKIEVGTEAFRAQYARLVALYLAPRDWPTMGLGIEFSVLRQLEDTYKVPIFTSLTKLEMTYPPSDIKHLLGESEPRPELVPLPGLPAAPLPTKPIARPKPSTIARMRCPKCQKHMVGNLMPATDKKGKPTGQEVWVLYCVHCDLYSSQALT